MKTAIARLAAMFAAAVTAAGPVAAATFASRPVTLVVPLAVGGSVDTIARDFIISLSDVIKQPVVIENKVGAEGVIGAQSVLNAKPDGHTLLFASASQMVLDP